LKFYSESHCQCLYPEVFSLFFPLGSLKISGLCESCWSIFRWFWYGVRDRNPDSVFYMWITNFSNTIFSRDCFWYLCQESNGYSSVGVFLGPLLFFIALCQYHAGLFTMDPLYNLKSDIVILLIFLFLLRIVLVLQDLLCFHVNFRNFFPSFVNNVTGILMRIALNL
jgi:hypothetical protein